MNRTSKRASRIASAALIAGLLGVFAPTTARADETATASPPSDEAKRLFASGIALLQDPEGERVEEAYAQFKRAYELSKLPKILGNIGYCAFRLERDGEAMEAYREYLRQVPDVDPREKAQVERDLASITSATTVIVDAKGAAPGDTMILRDTRTPVRGQPITNTYPASPTTTTLRIRPGHHTIVAVVANVERARWELDAAADATLKHTFDVTPEAPKAVASSTTFPVEEKSKTRVGPWVLIGVGGAALAAGVVTSIITASKVSKLDDQKLSTGQYPGTASFRDDRDSAKTLATTSYVLYAAGGVVAASGLAWLIFGGHSAEKSTAKVGLLPACGLDGCRASFQGTF